MRPAASAKEQSSTGPNPKSIGRNVVPVEARLRELRACDVFGILYLRDDAGVGEGPYGRHAAATCDRITGPRVLTLRRTGSCSPRARCTSGNRAAAHTPGHAVCRSDSLHTARRSLLGIAWASRCDAHLTRYTHTSRPAAGPRCVFGCWGCHSVTLVRSWNARNGGEVRVSPSQLFHCGRPLIGCILRRRMGRWTGRWKRLCGAGTGTEAEQRNRGGTEGHVAMECVVLRVAW